MDRIITNPNGFAFSNGTILPQGTYVAVAMHAIHHATSVPANADSFDGFRFANLREAGEGEGVKHQMVNTNVDYVSFGHGRHACPGRSVILDSGSHLISCIYHYFTDFLRPTN